MVKVHDTRMGETVHVRGNFLLHTTVKYSAGEKEADATFQPIAQTP